MDVKKINELGKELDSFLRLKTHSLGIKFFEKASDIPEEFQQFDNKQSICAIFGWSRFLEIPVALTKDKMADCPPANISLGWGEISHTFAEDGKGFFAETAKDTQKVIDGMMSLKGKFEAFGVCPLDTINIEPDLVQVWGNPLQLMMFEYASTWNGWDRIQLSTNGHGASCYEVLTVPYLTREIRFAIADNGDRRHGMASDDEMIMGCPINKLEKIIIGLRAQQDNMNRLPIIYNFDIPFPVPTEVLRRRFPNYR